MKWIVKLKSEIMEKNEEIVRKAFKVFETGNMEELNALVDENFVEHTPDPSFTSSKKGLEYLKDLVSTYRSALSGLNIEIKQIISCEDKVVAYSNFKGKNTGNLMDIQATNRDVSFDNIDILHLKNGKVSDHWGVADNLGLMMQLGVLDEKVFHSHH